MRNLNPLVRVHATQWALILATMATLLLPTPASADAVHYGYVWKRNASGNWEDKSNWNCINPAGGNCSTNPAENKGYPNVAGDEAFFDAGIITGRQTIIISRSDIRVAKIFLGEIGLNIQTRSPFGQIILNSGLPGVPAEIVSAARSSFDPFQLTQFFVPFVNESPLVVTTGANAQLLIYTDIGPFDNGVTSRGPGETILGRLTSYTGPTVVESGTLTFDSPDPSPTVNSRDLIIGSGAQAVIKRPNQLADGINVTVNGGTLRVLSQDQIGDMVLNGGLVYLQQVSDVAHLVTRNVAMNGGTVTASGGGRMLLLGDVTVGGQGGTINYDTLSGNIIGALELGDGQRRFTLNGSLVIGMRMLGNGGVTKDGAATLFLRDGVLGFGESRYSGEMRVTQGTLDVATTNASVPHGLIIGEDNLPAQVILREAGVTENTFTDVGPLGTLIVQAPLVIMQGLAVASGGHVVQNMASPFSRLQLQFALQLTGSADVDLQQGTLWVRDLVTATSAPGQVPVIRGTANGTLLAPQQFWVPDGPEAVDLRISVAMNNGGVSDTIRKFDPGLLELSGTNGFSSLTVASGTVRMASADSISRFASLTLSNFPDPGTIDVNGFDLTVQSLNGDGGRILLGARTLTINQTFAPPATFGGTIVGTGSLVKMGAGQQTFAGSQPNAFTGSTTVQAGTLTLSKSIEKGGIVGPILITGGTLSTGANNQFGDAVTVTLNSPGVFDLAGSSSTIASLTGNGAVRLGTGTLSLGTGKSTIFSGTMTGTSAAAGLPPEKYFRLIKIGLSTFTLTGTVNLGDQAVVDKGVLTLDTQMTGRGILVRNGSSLAGTGRLAAVSTLSASTGGAIAPGHGNPGILHADAANITGAFLIVQLAGTAAGSGYDQLDLTGGLTLGAGARLLWQQAATVPRGSALTVVRVGTTAAVAGTFSGMPEGSTFAGTGQTFRITYRGGDGNDVVVTAIDGPASLATTTDAALNVPTYFVPEGSTAAPFDEDILIVNPNSTAAPVTLTFRNDSGEQIVETRVVPALARITVHVDQVPGLESASVSAEVRSDSGMPLAVERAMFWDQTYYAGDTIAAVQQPAQDWHFADGGESSGYHTFVSLANPSESPTAVELTFLREREAPVRQAIALEPSSHLTLSTGDFPALSDRTFSVAVHAAQPIFAERSIFFGTAARPASGGTSSAGVSSPSTTWYFAEGATSDLFDTLFVFGNPHDSAAHLTLTYVLEDGSTMTAAKIVPANGRLTSNVKAESGSRMRRASFATRVTSDLPIVAERSMYWLAEGSNSAGVPQPAAKWLLAEGRTGGTNKFQTHVVLANLQDTPADVTITFLGEAGAPVPHTVTVPPMSSLSIDVSAVPGMQDSMFGAAVESTNGVPIVVERSMYWNANGVTLSGGSTTAAIRVP